MKYLHPWKGVQREWKFVLSGGEKNKNKKTLFEHSTKFWLQSSLNGNMDQTPTKKLKLMLYGV